MAVKERKGTKILVMVDVAGSTGPIRFVVDEEECVASVIDTVLRNYARQRRSPVLRPDINTFHLYCYCARTGYKALSPLESIGSSGSRKFGLYHKPKETTQTSENSTVRIRTWTTWTRKFFRFIIPSH